MNFYKEILPFIDYIHSIRKLKTYLSFDVKFPSKWSIPKTYAEEGQLITFESDDVELKGVSFVTPFVEDEVAKTLLKISKVIKLNKEREIKEVLFKQKVDELKKTFEKTDLERLQKLYFDFEKVEVNLNEDESNNEEPPTFELVEK